MVGLFGGSGGIRPQMIDKAQRTSSFTSSRKSLILWFCILIINSTPYLDSTLRPKRNTSRILARSHSTTCWLTDYSAAGNWGAAKDPEFWLTVRYTLRAICKIARRAGYINRKDSFLSSEGHPHSLAIGFPSLRAPSMSVNKNVTVPEGGWCCPSIRHALDTKATLMR